MVTYGTILSSLRAYLEEVTGVTSVWRYNGYTPPESDEYIAIRMANEVYESQTKLDELVTASIYFNLASYSPDVVTQDITQQKITEVLMYHTIPLYDYSGNQIGSFAVSRITGVNSIPYGTGVESESTHIAVYTDFVVEVDHIKKRS